jgi:chemotaxis family two-component system sensor kinase Cph1
MDQRSNDRSRLALAGAHILLVEDDRLILMDLEAIIEDAGAAIVDTCTDVSAALALLSRNAPIDAAVLDIRLRDESVAPVAHELAERRVPFVFYSGQNAADPIHEEWPCSKIIQKPAPAQAIVSALVEALEHRPAPVRGNPARH